MAKTSKRGGKRKGSGAPTTTDPKLTVRAGVKESVVTRVGGMATAQKLVPELLEQHAEKISQQ